ncbi:pentatricopeptide repeat-containing protein At2g22410, mitochondrial-like [Phalaenopsis equestris]|uniref:pentatricopeptide repeat-containing protein At2g22410, mitochondrial-like n=1 Tax=Phalaenopsis equestris TaxID=78828 RepID=UPI0009E2D6D7|nr:pentatricopeptide repeat-containing protein At2g22410, mitochondrial-like [Phalaenopsis equestris]
MKQLKQLQAQLTSHGLLSDTHTHTHTLSHLISCSLTPSGDLHHARQLFDRAVFPNRFMYNTLIRVYSYSDTGMESVVFLLRQMMAQGFSPNNFTFPFVLKSVAKSQAFEVALLLQSMIIKTGFASQVVVMNALLHAFVVSEHVCYAHKVFDGIPQKSIISWNSMIGGYSREGDFRSAFELFGAMRNLGLEPDEFTVASLFSVCSQSINLKLGRALHHFIIMNCLEADLIVNNALIDMYGKCGEPDSAQMCFDMMPVRNAVSWTSLVRAYAKNGSLALARSCFDQMREKSAVSWNAMIDCYIRSNDEPHEALVLYEQMKLSGIVPNEVTLIHVLSACSKIGNLVVGKRIHDHIAQNITNPSLKLLNSLTDMYAKCGHLDIALTLFNMIENKNLVSWNVVISALAAHGVSLEAVELFRSMTSHGFLPDGITFVGLLSACSHGGLLELGLHYFEAMDAVYKVQCEVEHYACMVDLFGRRGFVGRALELIGRMPMKPDVVIWGALLGACRIHGDLRTGLKVMKQVLELEDYSSGLFVLLSNLFCELQRWEDVRRVRKMMCGGGVKKVEGRSLIEIGGDIHEFLVEDLRHERSCNIYFVVDQLTDHLMCLAPFSESLEPLWL